MNPKHLLTLQLIFIMLLAACGSSDPNQSVDEGSIASEIYKNEALGWAINIPEGWTIREIEATEEVSEKRHDAMEMTVDSEVKTDGLKNLLGFKKDDFNSFFSTSQTFEPNTDSAWQVNFRAVKQITYNSYINRGMSIDTSETSIESINGLDFHTYSLTLYRDNGDVMVNQLTYGALHRGMDFSVAMYYNNRKNRIELLEAFRASTFLE